MSNNLMTSEEKLKNVSVRFRQILKEKKMKQIELAEKSNIDKSQISCYCSGLYAPNTERAYILSKILNVSAAWLQGHDVPMESKKSLETNKTSLTSEETEIITIYHSLDDMGKSIVKGELYKQKLRCDSIENK